MDLVSIIVPYYKKKKFIKRALLSVLNQSYKKFELILIYDDKNKKDLSYIKKLVKLDKRILLIVNNENLGVGFSRNKGINFSKGKYVCFLDSDDYWNKNKIKEQLNFMKNNKAVITHTSYNIIENNKIISTRHARNFLNFNSLIFSCDIGCSTVMLKKKILFKNENFPPLKTKEDFVLWLKLLKKGKKIYSIDKILSNWQKTPKSLSSNVKQKMFDGFKVYNQYMKFGKIKSFFYLFVLSINFLIKNN